MSDYASFTVAQLKEKLKAKDLPTDGKKADLVQRLTEADSASETAAPEPEETTETPAATEAEESKEETKDEKENKPAEEAQEEAEPEEPERKPLGPEERKQLAVDLLTKKIKRAEKFGDEALAQAARKDLARVEKFGVDAGTALAKEIGYMHKSINTGLKVQQRRGILRKRRKNWIELERTW